MLFVTRTTCGRRLQMGFKLGGPGLKTKTAVLLHLPHSAVAHQTPVAVLQLRDLRLIEFASEITTSNFKLL